MAKKANPRKRAKPVNRFIETARELGLDTKEAEEAFESAFGKIAPPKKKDDITPPREKKQKR
jgi:hypothetical protein